MPLQPLFPYPVFFNVAEGDQYDKVQEELNTLYNDLEFQDVYFNSDSPEGSHKVSEGGFDINLLEDNNTRYFLNFLHQQIQLYLNGFNVSDVPEYIITSSWMTKTTRGKYALSHSHGDADVSGVYYLNTNSEDGSLYFVDPHTNESANMIMDFAGRATNLDAPLKQGMLIMWPGFMSHGTRPNNTDNDRISVSFNIIFARNGFIKYNTNNSNF